MGRLFRKDTVFSEFLCDFSKEYIVHFRRLFGGARGGNEYQNFISVRPQYKNDIARMILLDFITRQDDRHLSNIAVKLSGGAEAFYPLYDNGRSLFYEDTEEMVATALSDPAAYATGFGFAAESKGKRTRGAETQKSLYESVLILRKVIAYFVILCYTIIIHRNGGDALCIVQR